MHKAIYFAMKATQWLKTIAAIGIIAGIAYLITLIPEDYTTLACAIAFILAIIALVINAINNAEPLGVDVDDKPHLPRTYFTKKTPCNISKEEFFEEAKKMSEYVENRRHKREGEN